MKRVEEQLALWAKVRAEGPMPYFAHMRLLTSVREVDVLLASASRISPVLSLIDWQAAPLAEVFFTHDEGETYELEMDQRTVAGTLLQKNFLTFEGGELVEVLSSEGRARRQSDGTWTLSEATPTPLPHRPPALRKAFRSPLEVQLDPAQQAVVDLPPEKNVLLLGEAGFGKTTVALHRLVSLRDREGAGFSAGVVVPTEGLRRLTQLMLDRRGVQDVDVWTYETLAATGARKVFPDLPRKESVNTTSRISSLKRHAAVKPVLAAYAKSRPRPAEDEDRPTPKQNPHASWLDLEQFFGDRQWTEQIVARSDGVLPATCISDVAQHTRIQFLDTTEGLNAGMDASSLTTIDGRTIDEGTPFEDAESVDPEDYAVLFELERLRCMARGAQPASLASYDCLVVDEAQEFAPLELRLLSRTLRPGGSIVISGDAAQQVDPTSCFQGWDATLEHAQARDAVKTVLEVNYRCPPEVTQLARSVLDPAAPKPAAEPSILRIRHPSLLHLASWLIDELLELLRVDPSASVALICRSPEAAKTFARILRHGMTPKLALDGLFDFTPGLVVTCVQEVKGLEFDYVIVPDANASTYPKTRESQRALYVALTRATHRLILAASGEWSPLLSK